MASFFNLGLWLSSNDSLAPSDPCLPHPPYGSPFPAFCSTCSTDLNYTTTTFLFASGPPNRISSFTSSPATVIMSFWSALNKLETSDLPPPPDETTEAAETDEGWDAVTIVSAVSGEEPTLEVSAVSKIKEKAQARSTNEEERRPPGEHPPPTVPPVPRAVSRAASKVEETVKTARQVDASELAREAQKRIELLEANLVEYNLVGSDANTGVIFLAPTSSGKTTTLLWLEGHPIEERAVPGKEHLRHLNVACSAPDEVQGLVGDGISARTITPRYLARDRIVYVDPAGFNDTRSVILAMINSMGLRHLLDKMPRKRIVLLVNFRGLSRLDAVSSMLQSLQRLCPDFEALAPGILFLYSRLDGNTSKEVIVELLNGYKARQGIREVPYYTKTLDLMIHQLERHEDTVLLYPHLDAPDGVRNIIARGIRDCLPFHHMGSPLEDGEIAMIQQAIGKELGSLHTYLSSEQPSVYRQGIKHLTTIRTLAQLINDEAISEMYHQALDLLGKVIQTHAVSFARALKSGQFEVAARHDKTLQALEGYNQELQQTTAISRNLWSRVQQACDLVDSAQAFESLADLQRALRAAAAAVGMRLAKDVSDANEQEAFAECALPAVATLCQFDQHLASSCSGRLLWNPIAESLLNEAVQASAAITAVVQALNSAITVPSSRNDLSVDMWQALRSALGLHQRAQAYSGYVLLDQLRTCYDQDKTLLLEAASQLCATITTIHKLMAEYHAEDLMLERLASLMALLRHVETVAGPECVAPGSRHADMQSAFARVVRDRLKKPIAHAVTDEQPALAASALGQLLALLEPFGADEVVQDTQRDALLLLNRLANQQRHCQETLRTILAHEGSARDFEALVKAIKALTACQVLDKIIEDARWLPADAGSPDAQAQDQGQEQGALSAKVTWQTSAPLIKRTIQELHDFLGSLCKDLASALNTRATPGDRVLTSLQAFHLVQSLLDDEIVQTLVAQVAATITQACDHLACSSVESMSGHTRDGHLKWLTQTAEFVGDLDATYPLLRSPEWASVQASLKDQNERMLADTKAWGDQLVATVRDTVSEDRLGETASELDALHELGHAQDLQVQGIAAPLYEQALEVVRRRLKELYEEFNLSISATDLGVSVKAKKVLIDAIVLHPHLPEANLITKSIEEKDQAMMNALREQFDTDLLANNFHAIHDVLTGLLQTQDAPEWRAAYRGLKRTAILKMQPELNQRVEEMQRAARGIRATHASTQIGDLLQRLDQQDAWFVKARVLDAALPELRLAEAEKQFSIIVKNIYHRLCSRLWAAMKKYHFNTAETLYGHLQAWQCVHRADLDSSDFLNDTSMADTSVAGEAPMSDSASEAPSDVFGAPSKLTAIERYAAELDTQVTNHVTSLLKERRGVELARVLRSLKSVYDGVSEQGLFTTDLVGLVDQVFHQVHREAQAELSGMQRTLYRQGGPAAAREQLAAFDELFRPLETQRLPPFENDESQICQLHRAVLTEVRDTEEYFTLPALSPEVADEILAMLAQGRAGNMGRVLDSVKALCKRAVADLQGNCYANELGLGLTDIVVDRFLGLAKLGTELKRPDIALASQHVNAMLGSSVTEGFRAVNKWLRSDLQTVHNMLKAFNVDQAREALSGLTQSVNRLSATGLPAESLDFLKMLQDTLESFTVNVKYGTDPVDRLDLAGFIADSFSAETLAARIDQLAMVTSAQHSSKSAPVFGSQDVFNPGQALNKVLVHWQGLLRQATTVVEECIAGCQDVSILAAHYAAVAKLAQRQPAELNDDVAKTLHHLNDRLAAFARSAGARVQARVEGKHWHELNENLSFTYQVERALATLAQAQLPALTTPLADSQEQALLSRVQAEDYVGNDTLDELARCLGRLQELSSNCLAERVKTEVKSRIKARLDGLKGQGSTVDLDLADCLSDVGEYGEEVKQSYNQFAEALVRQRKAATKTMTIDKALADMQAGPHAISAAHADRLRAAYDSYRREFETHIAKSTSAIPALVDAVRQKCDKVAHRPNALLTELPVILAVLAAIWSLGSRKAMAKASQADRGIYKELHTIQVLALFELLGLCDAKVGLRRVASWVKSFVPFGAHDKLSGAFVQIQTGGGKSILLGFASTLYALLGFEVSCACFSNILSSRDYNDFKDFFDVVQVAGLVKYGPLSELARAELNVNGDIRQALQTLVIDGRLSDPTVRPGALPKVLLVDEVDTLLSNVFLTEPYTPGTLVHDDSFLELLRAVWQDQSLTLAQIQALPSAQKLLQTYAHTEKLVLAALENVALARAAFERREHPYEVQEGLIAYKREGLDEPSSDISYGYETQFAYLAEEARGAVMPEVCRQHVGLFCSGGRFSFVKLIQKFDLISGVTGTIPDDLALLRTKFGVGRCSYMPSMYGKINFQRDPVQLTSNKAQQHQAIAGETFERAQGRAVIVFFQTTADLEAFRASPEFTAKLGGRPINIITVGSPDIPHRIKQATRKDMVTLATAPFGRGSDFTVLNRDIEKNGGIHVIQAFLSVEVTEQIQIEGRTARESNSGSYRLVLCLEDVQALLGEHFPSDIHEGAFAELPPTLDAARRTLHAEMLAQSFEALAACEAAHDTSLKLVRELFSGKKGDPQNALRYVHEYSAQAEYAEAVDVVVVVDISGSMGPHVPQAQAFVRTIAQEGFHLDQASSRNRLGILTFDVQAQAMGGEDFLSDDWTTVQQRAAAIATKGYQTFYLPPLKLLEEKLCQAKAADPTRYASTRRIVLFQTDGANMDTEKSSAIRATAERIVDELDTTLMAVLTGPDVPPDSVAYFVGRAGQFKTMDRSDSDFLAQLIITVDTYDALVQRASNIANCATSMLQHAWKHGFDANTVCVCVCVCRPLMARERREALLCRQGLSRKIQTVYIQMFS
ncbi:uncharacterized protein MONBRDRAFT_33917 [Monosiga brevicollis MX1]|uniref:VWFA domain-containing protein n=1 Tax=Monosiga brevicollis TaxID=81824 RepID=A9V8G1_MONBE|nr:uncharacterized protein MONBRDRAFT_33917 [Monosiga brevicollis MX1]EDQ86076.1 predicted protein [Monosiga brevicollis MX1]|eukprot:XP_001749001.1 hypothetical protein [Monosiga brevicollis MX1]